MLFFINNFWSYTAIARVVIQEKNNVKTIKYKDKLVKIIKGPYKEADFTENTARCSESPKG